MSFPINNHQLSLIAPFLSINHRKGGDRFFKEGRIRECGVLFFCFKVLGHGLREIQKRQR